MDNVQTCVVAFTDSSGIRHSTEVLASSLYEAVGRAIPTFRKCSLLTGPAAGAVTFEVEVRSPTVVHAVPFARLKGWLSRNGRTPKEQALKRSLRELLGM